MFWEGGGRGTVRWPGAGGQAARGEGEEPRGQLCGDPSCLPPHSLHRHLHPRSPHCPHNFRVPQADAHSPAFISSDLSAAFNATATLLPVPVAVPAQPPQASARPCGHFCSVLCRLVLPCEEQWAEILLSFIHY